MDSKIWKKSAILIREDFLPKKWINFKKVNVRFFFESFVEWTFEYCWWEGQIDAIKEILFEKNVDFGLFELQYFFFQIFRVLCASIWNSLQLRLLQRVLKWWWIVKISDYFFSFFKTAFGSTFISLHLVAATILPKCWYQGSRNLSVKIKILLF